tara:strand:+ start:160 stop:318 length:159 start_codon:yes stop_codon:yes gene_type:complete
LVARHFLGAPIDGENRDLRAIAWVSEKLTYEQQRLSHASAGDDEAKLAPAAR